MTDSHNVNKDEMQEEEARDAAMGEQFGTKQSATHPVNRDRLQNFVTTPALRKQLVDMYPELGNTDHIEVKLGDGTYPNVITHPSARRVTSSSVPESLRYPPDHEYSTVQFAGVELVPGVTVVLGKGSSAKTTFLAKGVDTTEDNESLSVLKAFEPTPNHETSHDVMCTMIGLFLASENSKTLVIDSFKGFVHSGKNLSAGGISKSLMQQLSDLSTVASTRDKVIIVSINISTDNQTILDDYFEALKSNTAGVIMLTTPGRGNTHIRNFVVGDRSDNPLDWGIDDATEATEVETEIVTSYTVNTTNLAAILARATSIDDGAE